MKFCVEIVEIVVLELINVTEKKKQGPVNIQISSS